MVAQESSLQNAFETTLTAEMDATTLSAVVASIGALTSPCILVIEPDSDTQREFVRFDGTFGGSTFVVDTGSGIGNRYLPGSAAGSGLTHPIGSVVASIVAQQHLEDLHDRIDLKLDATGKAADSNLLDAHDTSYFATASEFNAHDGGTDVADHPEVTTSVRGFMSAADKTKLDGLSGELDLSDATPDSITPDQTGAAGSGTEASRDDHAHGLVAAAPEAIGTANAEGNASSVARSNHVHEVTDMTAVGVKAGITLDITDTLLGTFNGVGSTSFSMPSGWTSALIVAEATVIGRMTSDNTANLYAYIVIDTSTGTSADIGNVGGSGQRIISIVHQFETSEATVNIEVFARWGVNTIEHEVTTMKYTAIRTA